MTATITVLDCGWLRQQERVLIDGASRDPIEIPVPAWLVRHPRGIVVLDAGLSPKLIDDQSSLGPMARLFTALVEPGGTLGPRLAEHDIDPQSAITVVLSHCHFDHVGGLGEVPNARVVVQRDEWAAALLGSAGGYDSALIDLGHDLIAIDGEHDLFGDGVVVCVPTPGHTCGHQSLRIATHNGLVILAADACYFDRTLDDGVLPPVGFDLDLQRASLDYLRRERASGVTIVPGHDAGVFTAMLNQST